MDHPFFFLARLHVFESSIKNECTWKYEKWYLHGQFTRNHDTCWHGSVWTHCSSFFLHCHISTTSARKWSLETIRANIIYLKIYAFILLAVGSTREIVVDPTDIDLNWLFYTPRFSIVLERFKDSRSNNLYHRDIYISLRR